MFFEPVNFNKGVSSSSSPFFIMEKPAIIDSVSVSFVSRGEIKVQIYNYGVHVESNKNYLGKQVVDAIHSGYRQSGYRTNLAKDNGFILYLPKGAAFRTFANCRYSASFCWRYINEEIFPTQNTNWDDILFEPESISGKNNEGLKRFYIRSDVELKDAIKF